MRSLPDKRAILAAVRARVDADLAAVTATQRETHAGATHEESRPENDKDTRALEASYLARGLARRVGELERAATQLAALALRPFGDGDPVAAGALVRVADDEGEHHYFVAPAGGGITVSVDGVDVGVVTGQSPLGRALLGKRIGDDLELVTPRGPRDLAIVAVA